MWGALITHMFTQGQYVFSVLEALTVRLPLVVKVKCALRGSCVNRHGKPHIRLTHDDVISLFMFVGKVLHDFLLRCSQFIFR